MPNTEKGRITEVERMHRISHALELIARHGTPDGIWPKLCTEYGCARATARRYVRAAMQLAAADSPETVRAQRARIRKMLDDMLNEKGVEFRDRLAALKQAVDLYGLAAPARAELAVSSKPFDPIEAYQQNPELMEKALQLQREAGNARIALDAEQTRRDSNSRVSIPAPSASAGNGHHANLDQPGPE